MRIASMLPVLGCALVFVGCVPAGGRGGGGGGGGSDPADARVESDATCQPDCTDRVCGSDGCGGVCGECPDEAVCTATGECLEVPATCGDMACSPDDGETCETCPVDCGQCCGDGACTADHGEHCGTCPADCGCPEGEACDVPSGTCGPACTPACEGRACGSDGCGGECGVCADGEVCGGDGTCAPPPASCGDGTCGEDEDCANCVADCPCDDGQLCEAGVCVDGPRCGDGTCDAGEDCGSCMADCPCADGQNCEAGACVDAVRCGDGACDADEDCGSCAADCACADGFDCVNAECVCLPDCVGAVCGDDGCGGSCGACPDGAACAGGECVFDCPDDCGAPWVGACTGDGFGYRLCIPDAARPGCTTLSRRIPCGEGRECGGQGVCDGVCVKPEVILLIDRSSSMIGERWAFTRDALQAMAADRTRTARLGLRTFPGAGDGCAAGAVTAPDFEAEAAFGAIPEPAQVAQTPIAAAFDGVEAIFGDPDEGESVILLTDGDETCEDELAAVGRAEALRRRGVRTFVVGITRQANGELLSAIARAGGTAPDDGPAYYTVEDGPQLIAALGDIFERLGTCACVEGEQRCADAQTFEQCAADGFGFDAQACDFGCDIAQGGCFGSPDTDGDGVRDDVDNCLAVPNPDQRDGDRDAVGDACDNCPARSNRDQDDGDRDGVGSACDVCPEAADPAQGDVDGDGRGDACDNCPARRNAGQGDVDLDGVGDVCDNCPAVGNRNQLDSDRDRVGDACDLCPALSDPDAPDVDGDGFGDLCDNCPDTVNPDQRDADGDGRGDACPVQRVCDACEADADCPAGGNCLFSRREGLCATACNGPADCGPGLECLPIADGTTYCIPPNLTCTDLCVDRRCPADTLCNRFTGACDPLGVLTCGPCDSEEQCGGVNPACLFPQGSVVGFCSPPCSEGCPAGYNCQEVGAEEPYCIPPNVQCGDPCADVQCAPWQVCDAAVGACLDRPACADQSQCPPGAYCDRRSTCQPTGAGAVQRDGPCGGDVDCAVGLVCGSIDAFGIGACTAACTAAGDCPAAAECVRDPSDQTRNICRAR